MIKVSIVTPTHNTKWLQQAYDSIKEQDFDEWVVLYNNGAVPIPFYDPRVKTFDAGSNVLDWVGFLKADACSRATGDVLLELDCDDMLMPGAVEEVRKAFEDEAVGFAYSNSIRVTEDLQKTPRFDESYGWRYREVEFQGKTLDELIGFEPSPCSVGRIWYAPDHLRAFRKSVYDAVGGHSKKMRVLDDQDLMCRLYQVTKFHHINKGLYLYRIHGANTWLANNSEIQQNVLRLHDQYIEGLAEKWARDRGLKCLDLGGRIAARPGFTTVDLRDADVITNLNRRWPFKDGSVGVVRAYDVFEHLKDPVHVMLSLYRVLAPGGYAIIQVPSTDGRGAFQDPTHVSFWNENSFLYYTDRSKNLYIDCPVRFQAIRLYTTGLNEQQVSWVHADLVKLSDDRVPGPVLI